MYSEPTQYSNSACYDIAVDISNVNAIRYLNLMIISHTPDISGETHTHYDRDISSNEK